MNYLPKLENCNGMYVVSSRIIANQLGKRHSHVLESIDNVIKNQSAEILADFKNLIIPNTYADSKNRNYREYLLTKDGFTLYMFNIQGYNDFKLAYINEFNRMEKELKQLKLPTKDVREEPEIAHTTWRGQPVMEVKELAKILNVGSAIIHFHSTKKKKTLKFSELAEYKIENSCRNYSTYSAISILFKETVIAICKHFNVYEKYKDVIENYFRIDNKLEDKSSVPDNIPFNDRCYSEMYECMQKAYMIESKIEKMYIEELLPLYNRIEKLNEIKRDCMISLFKGMKYGNILGKGKSN